MTAKTTTVIRRVVLVSFVVAAASAVGAQNHRRYRTYAMGDDVLSVTQRLGLSPLAATERPPASAAVRELRWQAHYVRRGGTPAGDPVARLIFSFYENRLFRIVVDYDADRTAGMTEGDMVAAVAKMFGTPTRRIESPHVVGSPPVRPVSGVIAQWIDGEHSVALLALQGGTAFRMIVSSGMDEALAVEAGAGSVPTDVPDWASIGAARARAATWDEGPSRERMRQANIVAFVP